MKKILMTSLGHLKFALLTIRLKKKKSCFWLKILILWLGVIPLKLKQSWLYTQSIWTSNLFTPGDNMKKYELIVKTEDLEIGKMAAIELCNYC